MLPENIPQHFLREKVAQQEVVQIHIVQYVVLPVQIRIVVKVVQIIREKTE